MLAFSARIFGYHFKTIDRIFTESKNFIRNFWRDAHFNFADFHGQVLKIFLVYSNRFITNKINRSLNIVGFTKDGG